VILAILMAVAVPALTGYIGKAQGQASAQALKTMHTALQTMATQDFANGYVKTSNAHNPSAEITYYGLSLQPIGTDQYFSVYIAYEKDAPDASFRHLLTYLGADEPPNFPSDCNQAQLRFLISPDTGRVVALDYVARDKTSGKIKLRVTWHFDGAKQKLSSAVSANLDDSGYTVRYLDGQLISGTTPAW
jgi:type II secretory pathway pseudopilin PulG